MQAGGGAGGGGGADAVSGWSIVLAITPIQLDLERRCWRASILCKCLLHSLSDPPGDSNVMAQELDLTSLGLILQRRNMQEPTRVAMDDPGFYTKDYAGIVAASLDLPVTAQVCAKAHAMSIVPCLWHGFAARGG